jgi:hypothetical protein
VTDQVPVPAEQGLGLDAERASVPTIKESAQAGEQRSIRVLHCRPGHLATKHSNFVAKHDDFDRQLLVPLPQEREQLEHADEDQVQEGQCHGPDLSFGPDLRKSCSDHPDDILGTHTITWFPMRYERTRSRDWRSS